MDTKGLQIKSPCVGSFSIKEIVAFSIVIFTLIFNGAFIFYQVKDLPEKVNINSRDIVILKTDFKGLQITVDSIDERTKNTDDKVQDIWKHLLSKK